MIIRRFGVWSVARLYGSLLAAMGLLFGAIIALASMIGGASGAFGQDSPASAGPMAAIFGVGAIIALPIFYGVLGVVMGAITAGLYNLFAGMLGGIEVETEP
jgi:hypothetical protein